MIDAEQGRQPRPEHDYFARYGGSAPENYQRFFVPAIGGPLAADLLEVAALRANERVLDVACGTGAVTRMAKQRVGNAGVAGLDVNPGMLAVARSVTSQALSIEWHEAGAESIPLPDESFDVVLCHLGLQFFADKLRALREMHRVLAPGGRMALNVVGPIGPVFAALRDELAWHIDAKSAAFVDLVFSLHDAEALYRLAGAAGFRDASVRSRPITLCLPAPAEFLWQYIRSTPLAGAATPMTDDGRAALERAVVEKWRPFVENATLLCPIEVVVVAASK